jgi:glycosyltransferase involved in cell wall biosynthesis
VIISVVTVVYNNVAHIGSAIESVLSQDYSSIEYIIIDGGSTDGSLDVIERYQDKIQIFLSESDEGIYDALNKGSGLATGEIVGFLHSDDLYAHDKVISRVAERFSKSNVDVVYGDLDYVRQDDLDAVVRHWRAGEFSIPALRRGWMPPHPTFYVRRKVYERLGIFDLNYRIAADYDCMLRILSDMDIQVSYLAEVLVKMRLGGVSNQNIANIIQKSREDYWCLKSNRVGGVGTLLWKNFRKIPQFFVR